MQVGIVISHQYRLLSIAALLDVLETVNRFCREKQEPEPYDITLFMTADYAHQNRDGLFGHKVASIDETRNADLILVPSFTSQDMRKSLEDNREFVPWMNKQYRRGAQIASFCTGAFLLASTGLLDGKLATTHVDASRAFASAFPLVDLRPDKTVTQDGRLFSSGGATSTFHLLLYLVELHCGREMAVKAAKVFAIDMDRHNQSYFSTFQPSRSHSDDLVATAQQKIETSYHDTGTIEEMIKDIPSSRRNIVRRFKQVTGVTPIEYLQLTRIEAAKKLLEQTSQQMTEIIYNSGYNDPKAFRKVFRRTVGMTPTEYREKFQTR